METIIAAYDGRPEGEDAVVLARHLAAALRGRLVVAQVFSAEPAPGSPEAAKDLSELAAGILPRLGHRLDGAEAEPLAVRGSSVPRALYALADGCGASMVVVGSTSRGTAGRLLAGTVAERMLQGGPCPVAVAPRGLAGSEFGLRVLAVGYDDSPEARVALDLAGRIALGAGATVRVVGVLEHPPAHEGAGAGVRQIDTGLRAGLQDAVHDAAARLPEEVRALPVCDRGNPAVELRDRCEEGVDLLVVGSRGYGPVRRVLLGSVSSMLVSSVGCPVIVVPRSHRDGGAPRGPAQPAA
ncbi:MAG: universal stress protein [Solirubrobacterales bacterium]